jgi:hypothetical protein
MPSRKRWVAVAFAGAVATVSTTALAGSALAQREDSATLTPVDAANEKAPGLVTPNTLSPEFAEVRLAEGARKLENPDGTVRYYGYLANEPMVPLPGTTAEAQKTEPDKNTYLVLDGQHGADAAYDYGTHFVYQGHEGGTVGSITRINLDADGKHRVTLLATKDAAGAALPTFDGSTWDPWANRLLFTAEGGAKGGVWQATPDLPSKVEDISGALGRGGYEGIQNDSDGNIWMVEDVGGPKGTANPHARQPNSFVYRFVPKDRADLTAGGRLQALQVLNASGRPIVYGGAANVDSDIRSADTKALHTYGGGLQTKWVTVHDTATDPTSTGFDANASPRRRRQRRSSGRRTASSSLGPASAGSSSPRPVTRTR